MKNYRITFRAQEDIENIALYIAKDNPSAALKLTDEF